MAAFRAFWNSPVGPKTTHFWGPIANWGFVVAVLIPVLLYRVLYYSHNVIIILYGGVGLWMLSQGLVDTQKPPEMISSNMTAAMCVYSGLFMRFAWMVQPRNYLLLACHASNESVQLYQLSRWAKSQGYLGKKEPEVQQ